MNASRPHRPGTEPARPSLLARFIGNRKGATAIEFGVLALPFALLVFAVLETCISFAGQQLLANATDDVAREIRTGQIKNITDQQLRDNICAKLKIIVGTRCDNQHLFVDLEQYDTFEDAAKVRTKITDGDLDDSGFGVDAGGPLTKNMLRVYYKWPVITDFMSRIMSNLKDGKMLLFATVTWQNEPF